MIMKWKYLLEEIFVVGLVVLVLVINDVEKVVFLVKVFMEGGIKVLEVILCIFVVIDVIKCIVEEVFDLFIGVGMVMNV